MNLYKKVGYILALLGGFFWSISGVCGEYLFLYAGWDSEGLVPYRLLISGVVLVIYSMLVWKKSTFIIFKNPKDTITLIGFAIFGVALCQYTYFKGISYSNTAIVTAIQYISPALIVLYLLIFKSKKPTVYEVVAVILAVMGTYILSTHLDPAKLQISPLALFISLVSAVSVAIYAILPEKLIIKYSVINVTGFGMLIGGIVMCIICSPWKHIGDVNIKSISAFLVVVFLGTVISFTFFLEGIKRIGAVKGNILSSVEPIGAIILCMIFFKTEFKFLDFIGMALIIATVFILAAGDIKKENDEN
ncbi:MAG: EamA family transporter [Clostridia bacterium]|nr:EamA family transporter [Clostridia bacterium]